MSKILVDLLPAMGHFNSSLKLIQMLQSKGHEIIFIDQGLKAEIAKFGFKSVTTHFECPPVFLKKDDIRLRKIIKHLFSRINEDLFSDFDNRFKKFRSYMDEISPDIVLLDEQNMLKAIYYEICKVPVISIESKPEPCMDLNVPPFTSYFIPSETFISRCKCAILWTYKIIINRLILTLTGAGLMGNYIYNFTKKTAAPHGIDLEKKICLKRSYGIGIKGIPRLNVSAAAFDFIRKKPENTHNIGPLLTINREEGNDQLRYNVLRSYLTRFRESNTGSVIYCSLGSHNVMFQKELSCFLIKLKRVALESRDDLFILSTGDEFDPIKLWPIPDNMYVFEYVPQTNLLGYCDIMITHGGINSITECIFNEIPTLNYPVSKDWDQPGCSARVMYHKIGLRGRIFKDSPKTIIKKLEILKSNSVFYKKNIRKMKKQFEKKNNSLEGVEIIEDWIRQNQNKYEPCKFQ